MVIDGNKFLARIGITGDEFTAEDIKNALMKIGKDEVDVILVECSIGDDACLHHRMMTLADCIEDIKKDESHSFSEGFLYSTEVDLKKQIKYERNPMRRNQLQMELSTMNSWKGKHRKVGYKKKFGGVLKYL